MNISHFRFTIFNLKIFGEVVTSKLLLKGWDKPMAILTTRVQRFFHLFFLSTTSEKSFIPYKASAAVQALKVCPVRPRVLSSWGISSIKE